MIGLFVWFIVLCGEWSWEFLLFPSTDLNVVVVIVIVVVGGCYWL